MGESNFHNENGSPQTKIHLNPCQNMPRVQEHLAELRFLHFQVAATGFLKSINQIYPKWSKYIQAMSIFLVFVTK